MEKQVSIFIVVVTSFQPLYMECNKILRNQCDKYKIPVLFLFNGKVPDGYTLQNDERIISEAEEMNPWMFLKFKSALREIFGANLNPDYIIRCNSSTFINIKKLKIVFAKLPRERCLAAPFGYVFSNVYCFGTCMIFSNDVARHIAFDENIDDACRLQNDDIYISNITETYASKFDINYFFNYSFSYANKIPSFYDIMVEPRHVFFRIKNEANRLEIDFEYWKLLYHLYDDLQYYIE